MAALSEFLDFNKAQRYQQNPNDGNGEAYDAADEEDVDELGFYPDGVERTLTDDQIAIFRHSEIQALLRGQDDKALKTRRNSSSPSLAPVSTSLEEAVIEDADMAGTVSKLETHRKKRKRKKRGSGVSKRRFSPDPERRKRTWDIVETGLDGLDYDEMEQSQISTSPARQRRRITYCDG